MKSIDGILPVKKVTKKRKHIPIYPQKYFPGDIVIAPHPDICLHKQCIGCANGTCSGVHMLSCPCSSCSPRM